MNAVRFERAPDQPVRWHPYAEIFPWLEGPALEEFVDDIRRNGVLEPIVFLEGAILDGRNRYMAARKLGIEYPRVEFDGPDPLAFVLSKNLARRHLTESQRAMVGARVAKLPQGFRSDLQPSASLPEVIAPEPAALSQPQAAELLSVSERSIRSAKQVQEAGAPELIAAVDAGLVSVSAAADVATLPEEEQTEIVAKGEAEILQAAKAVRAKKVEAKRSAKVERAKEIAKANVALPIEQRKYSAIYVDPPWRFDAWSGAGTDRAAENHYPTMTQADLEALPVGDLATDDCALFMWAVMPQLPEALRLIEAWGFKYKTCAFVWTKLTQDEERFATGMGYWTRANAELCLLATRGSPPRLNADVHQVVSTPRMAHSQKPDEVAVRIERLVPGPYIELFARRPRNGWDVWGNQSAGEEAA